ncbi:MAG TPA: GntR family transcriptional regulator [Acidimicrobiia bacterium]|nr:GntR family transcriptional regulator [Acidimicrobiia bacterium]
MTDSDPITYEPGEPVRLGPMTRPRTATDFVSGSIRRSILNGELVGGTRLSLATLASAFDVSTTPVREALRELSFEGLVRLDSYRGGTVNAVTRADVEEIVRIRQVLEPIAVREAVAAMTSGALEAAEKILEYMERDPIWENWVEGNRSFHQKLYSVAPSKRLTGMIKGLQDTTVVFMSATVSKSAALRSEAAKDHRDILEAMRVRDVDTAIEVTLRHLAIPIRQ